MRITIVLQSLKLDLYLTSALFAFYKLQIKANHQLSRFKQSAVATKYSLTLWTLGPKLTASTSRSYRLGAPFHAIFGYMLLRISLLQRFVQF
jgi:hypothetical protein